MLMISLPACLQGGKHLRGKDGEGDERVEEPKADPVRGKLPYAKITQNQVQLAHSWQP